jgi:hypothetical protein
MLGSADVVNFRQNNALKRSVERKEGIMKSVLAALLTSLGLASAQAYTCDDVRTLSSEQKAYYIRVFSITPAQQERIRHACSEPRTHQAATAVDARTSRFGHRERDARADQ